MMQGTQPSALTGNSLACEMRPIFKFGIDRLYALNQQEVTTEDMVNLYLSAMLRIKGQKSMKGNEMRQAHVKSSSTEGPLSFLWTKDERQKHFSLPTLALLAHSILEHGPCICGLLIL